MKLFFFLFMSVSLAAQTVTVPVPQSMANINASLNNLNAGKLHYAGAWSSGTPYNQSDVVTYSGSTYVSLQGSNANQNPATASAYWSVFASTSSNGVPAGTFAAKPATCTPGSVYFATISPAFTRWTASSSRPSGRPGQLVLGLETHSAKSGTTTFPKR